MADPNNPAATQLLLNPTFQAVNGPTAFDPATGRVMVAVNQIDGEFIITMQKSASAGLAPQGGNGTAGAGGATGEPQSASSTSGLSSAASGQGGITFTMAELTSLMEQQRMGSAGLAITMMQAASGGVPI
ncbi:hypothetical protein ONS96_003345 [Cadophora gregata f. sp. sojae]|nr:hypothetical protein ONS96_003345 [Cadophora gregata f. sp. sojae]